MRRNCSISRLINDKLFLNEQRKWKWFHTPQKCDIEFCRLWHDDDDEDVLSYLLSSFSLRGMWRDENFVIFSFCFKNFSFPHSICWGCSSEFIFGWRWKNPDFRKRWKLSRLMRSFCKNANLASRKTFNFPPKKNEKREKTTIQVVKLIA